MDSSDIMGGLGSNVAVGTIEMKGVPRGVGVSFTWAVCVASLGDSIEVEPHETNNAENKQNESATTFVFLEIKRLYPLWISFCSPSFQRY